MLDAFTNMVVFGLKIVNMLSIRMLELEWQCV